MPVKIGVLRENALTEPRAALVPAGVERLVKKGAVVEVETGVGLRSNIADEAYAIVGASIVSDRSRLLASSDILVRLQKPALEEADLLKPGSIHISFLDPFNDLKLVERLAQKSVNAVSLEMIPRTTRAQKMDVLSSQASLAGYAAVILAAERLLKIFPLMMTPAGTISPARVLVLGAGVAGLQAIATAKRLGARVEAFDTRPAAEEQVLSLGAKFIKIDLGETGQTQGGYAKALTEEQLNRQRQALLEHCRNADVVITTAQVFGKKAPILVTREMVEAMKPGSVIVDLAVESGGNVEGIVFNEEVVKNGVRLVGFANLAGRVPMDASQMISSNIIALVEEYWDAESKSMVLKEDDILKGCLITRNGKIVHPSIESLIHHTTV